MKKNQREKSFEKSERAQQEAYLIKHGLNECLRPKSKVWMENRFRSRNLCPEISEPIEAYFSGAGQPVWHRFASHAMSSQVCCVNFLAPLAERPGELADVIGRAIGRDGLKMIPVENSDRYVGFEWTGNKDYIGEWPPGGRAARGANATSADAVVRFESAGRLETLLIEWKYTEKYGTPPDREKEQTRASRYREKAFYPQGPLKADLGLSVEDLFWEPVYQMFRQQMLAFQMQQALEDGAERVSVLHVSPAGNTALHKITPPKLQAMGEDVFEVFKNLLVKPEDFTSCSIEHAFLPTLQEHKAEPWAAYLFDRYSFLAKSP